MPDRDTIPTEPAWWMWPGIMPILHASGVITPGMGFVYNNSMKLFDPYPGSSNSIKVGKARTTGMVPTMLLRDGKPAIVVGAPGGSVIISAVLQSILNIVDFGMSPVEAVTVPRIHWTPHNYAQPWA